MLETDLSKHVFDALAVRTPVVRTITVQCSAGIEDHHWSVIIQAVDMGLQYQGIATDRKDMAEVPKRVLRMIENPKEKDVIEDSDCLRSDLLY
jgi:hypothetical protein